ncbi:unnamed protein product [Nyctereutes procyonoides]|uniref:(raccoon dog) hypothetical protein n=1 Tax=Nyctereutes procyonoides TaxID=34880 RepID=A0A811Y750_NYCPR|nr:unnamed protein product [Nyctereutes procyonoides]
MWLRTNNFLDKKVKLEKKKKSETHQENGDHMMNFCRLAGPQAELDKYLFKKLTLLQD